MTLQNVEMATFATCNILNFDIELKDLQAFGKVECVFEGEEMRQFRVNYDLVHVDYPLRESAMEKLTTLGKKEALIINNYFLLKKTTKCPKNKKQLAILKVS